jgi:hypothetical protein
MFFLVCIKIYADVDEFSFLYLNRVPFYRGHACPGCKKLTGRHALQLRLNIPVDHIFLIKPLFLSHITSLPFAWLPHPSR